MSADDTFLKTECLYLVQDDLLFEEQISFHICDECEMKFINGMFIQVAQWLSIRPVKLMTK